LPIWQKRKVKKNNMSKKRLGRGYGSGKGGHTVGRGQKGQKSRGNINILFQGVKVKKSTIKRLPLLRGKGKFLAGGKFLPVKLDKLNVFSDGDTVDMNSLSKKGIINPKNKNLKVKILGSGELKKRLIVKLPVSVKARDKILGLKGEI